METTKQRFQIKEQPFGQLNEVTISNGDCELTFIPGFGGYITAMKVMIGGQLVNIIDGYTDYQTLITRSYFKSALLLPFPNRLNDGKYTYEGKTYHFPINDKSGNNNLHGFYDCYDMDYQILQLEEDRVIVELTSTYKGENPSYPFPFDFSVKYCLSENNALECEIFAKNTGSSSMPFGFGWHPYFKIGTSAKTLQLQMPTCQIVEVNKDMIPTGVQNPYNQFILLETIGDTFLDNCFALKQQKGKAEVKLYSDEFHTTITYWQEADKFPFFQIFTPTYGTSIAIEPMTCNVDAFNNKDGLLELQPNETFTGKFGIDIKSIW